MLAAIGQQQAHAGAVRAGALELAALERAPQLHRLVGRLGEVDIDRIDLLHHRQRRGFTLADQRAFGHQRAANAARDRGRDPGIAEVDARGLQGRLGHGHIGLGLLLGRLCADEFLLADGLGLDQRLVALGQRAGLHQVGLGLGQAGLGAVVAGLVGAGIDGKQHLTGLDFAAFAEQSLLQDTGGTRPHLGHARGLEPARQLGDQADLARRHGQHADFGRRHAGAGSGRSRGLVAAGGEQGGQAEGAEGGAPLRRATGGGRVDHWHVEVRNERGRAHRPCGQGNAGQYTYNCECIRPAGCS